MALRHGIWVVRIWVSYKLVDNRHASNASDARNYDGRTALHIAVAENQEEIVRYLVSQGSNPRLEDRLGRTAFSELPNDSSNMTELLEWGESLQINASDLTILAEDN